MTDKSKPRRLSDTVKPGEDFEAKIEIKEILGQDVLITGIEKAEGDQQYSKVDPDTGEIVNRDYWNVAIELDGRLYTFSCGAIPVNKVLTVLQHKLSAGEAELPLLATFRKEGRTYVVE